MIAKIGRGSNLYGALAYNNVKIERGNGMILLTNRMIETPNRKYTVSQLTESFESYLVANRNTEKHTVHISLNPDPKDAVSDDQFREMAEDYMQEMGYGEQPFVVFKHTDIDRIHIHIVSVCVDEEGRKISDTFEKRRSMNFCRKIEKKYSLIPATEKEQRRNEKIFRPVEYASGDVKSQIASVIRYLPSYYKFRSLGEYNALLSLFNIAAEKAEGELSGKMKSGLLYFPLNSKGDRMGHSFKASLFGKNSGLAALEDYFTKCKETLKNDASKLSLSTAILNTIRSTNNEKDFKNILTKQGINTVIRRNDNGHRYGITFVDHHSKTVWNGSHLGKEFSINSFNERWTQKIGTDVKQTVDQKTEILKVEDYKDPLLDSIHPLFDFLDSPQSNHQDMSGIIDGVGGLFYLNQNEDDQELQFESRMKKRRKRNL